MSTKELVAKIVAKFFVWKIKKWSKNPVKTQKKVFRNLILKAKKTRFGKDHNFSQVQTHEDFVKNVKVKDYEGLATYIKKVVDGEENILGQASPCILQKHQVQLLELNIFQLLKNRCPLM